MLNKENYQLLSQYRSPAPAPGSSPDNQRFRLLVEQKFIKLNSSESIDFKDVFIPSALVPKDWIITVKGLDALSEFEEQHEKLHADAARQKADKTREFRFQLLNTILGAVMGAVLTLTVQNFSAIIAWIVSVFQSFAS